MIGDLFRAARRYLRVMADNAGKKRKKRVQYAALPYRWGADGLEILLITSRETRRWVLPKGWPIKGLKPAAAARREALEEAGLVGRIAKNPAGHYEYDKRLRTGATVTCKVAVFPLRVEKQRQRWPEMGQREARWFTAEGAAGAVAEAGLADLFLRFQESRARRRAAQAKGARARGDQAEPKAGAEAPEPPGQAPGAPAPP